MTCIGQGEIRLISLLYDLPFEYKRCMWKTRTFYANLHNIEYCQFTKRIDTSRPTPWDKILLLIQNLKERKYVIWFDADVWVKNMLVSPKAIFGVYPHKHIIYTPDMYNEGINTGVIFVRNSSFVHDYMRRIYNYSEFIDDSWWEQRAILYDRWLYSDEFSENNIVVQHEYLNYVGTRPFPFFAFTDHTAGGYNLAKYDCNNIEEFII
jgi:hypothetical protein